MSTGLFSVFAGNIPFDVSDDEMTQLFARYGNVSKFRFVIDKSTGKSKGYGFCDFEIASDAQNAIDSLDGFTLRGRTIKVDSADKNQDGSGAVLKAGKQQREIDKALAELGLIELYDILAQFKAYLNTDYNNARKVLNDYPVLAQALVKICEIFNSMNKNKDGGEENMFERESERDENEEELNDEENQMQEDVVRQLVKLSGDELLLLPSAEKDKVLQILQAQVKKLSR